MKRFLFFLLLLGLPVLMTAQIELRPSLGLTVSSLENLGEDVEFESQLGYTFGADLMMGSRFYIQPGLHYEATQNVIKTALGEEADLMVSRVRIPVMLGFKLFDADTDRVFNFRGFTGPNMSIVTSVDDGESQLDIDKDDFKSMVFGWNAGVGIDVLILFLDAGYQFGLSEVFEEFNVQGLEGENSTNNVFYLNAGVRIRF